MSAEYKTLDDRVKEELLKSLPMVFQAGEKVKELLVLVNKRTEELKQTQDVKE